VWQCSQDLNNCSCLPGGCDLTRPTLAAQGAQGRSAGGQRIDSHRACRALQRAESARSQPAYLSLAVRTAPSLSAAPCNLDTQTSRPCPLFQKSPTHACSLEHEGGNLYFAPPDLVAPRHRSYLRFHCPSFPPLSLPLWSSLPLPPASLAVLVAASVALSRTRTDIDTHEDADGQGAYQLSQTSPTPTLLPRQRLRAQALSPLAAALPSPRRTPTP
jgi:hypothetical protein